MQVDFLILDGEMFRLLVFAFVMNNL